MRQRKVVSNKLFPFNRRLDGELLEMRENENLVRKILMKVRGRRDEGKGKRGYSNIPTFQHSNIS